MAALVMESGAQMAAGARMEILQNSSAMFAKICSRHNVLLVLATGFGLDT